MRTRAQQFRKFETSQRAKDRDRQKARPASSERLYGWRWQKARDSYLKENPLCVECMKRGITREAKVVDHIVPHRGNWDLFWDRDNWQSLCESDHNRAKQIVEGGGIAPGCDANGIPLDPNHHWRRKHG